MYEKHRLRDITEVAHICRSCPQRKSRHRDISPQFSARHRKRKPKSQFSLYFDCHVQWEPGAPVGPMCSLKRPAGSERRPRRGGGGVAGAADRGIWWPRGLPRAGEQGSRVPGGPSQKQGRKQQSRTATEASPRNSARRPPPRLVCRAGAHCWDSRALLFAFIFSRRFTKWPLLTSSSSVLSNAQRSSLWSFRFSALSSSSIFSAFSAADL